MLPDVAGRFSLRRPRDQYVRVDINESVNPRFVGRRRGAGTLEEVTATCEGTEVARHRRVLARHQTILAPEHAQALRQFRVQQRVSVAFAAALDNNVAGRDLAASDRALSGSTASHKPTATAISTPSSRLRRYSLLIIDEVGYIPFEADAANVLFERISAPCERASVIVTSNKPVGRWGETFGDATVAAAIGLKGDSYRLKDGDLGRVPTDDQA